MRKFFAQLLPVVLLIGLPATSPAQNVTVDVDCANGGSINEALRTVASELTINISGTCTEDVKILRSRVNLVGGDPLTDGIAPDGDTISRALVIFGANTINLTNLRLVEGRFGLSINSSFGIRANNVHIEVENGGYGVIAGSASGSINFSGISVTSVGTGHRGLWATNGSSLSCYGCMIDSFRFGVRANGGSQVNLFGTEVHAEEFGAYIAGGSRLFADGWCSGEGCIRVRSELDGGSGLSLSLQGTASTLLRETRLSGVLNVTEKSVLTLRRDVEQIATSGANWVSRGSSLIVDGQASLQMDYNISEFSNLTLPGNSTIRGALSCHTGGDAYCGDQTNILSGSDCESCAHTGSQCITASDCGEDNACTNTSCVQGICEVEITECWDESPDDCLVSFCDPFLGCVTEEVEQYSPCDDGDACSSQDYCDAGECKDGCYLGSNCEIGWCGEDGECQKEPVECWQDPNNDCVVSHCDPYLGCVTDELPDFTSCDDGDACVIHDYCLAGVCQDGCYSGGTCDITWCGEDGNCQYELADCGDVPNDCRIDHCDPFLGCVSDELPDGTACDDDNPDTTNDQCIAGTCTGET